MATVNRTADLQDKWKYDVNAMLDKGSNQIPSDNGYFGQYTLVTYKKKQAVVFVDDRDGKVKVITDWYDKIYYNDPNVGYKSVWSGDYRWNFDMPLIAQNYTGKNAGIQLIKTHSNKELLDKPVQQVWMRWYKDADGPAQFLRGTGFDGVTYNIYENGLIVDAVAADTAPRTLEAVKTWSIDKIKKDWVDAGKRCAHIHGLEYKGARPGVITTAQAQQYWPSHHSFNGTFESAEWRIMDGQVTLLFRDYANSDYD